MMRRVSGLLLVALGVALLVAQGVRASERNTDGFDALVKGAERALCGASEDDSDDVDGESGCAGGYSRRCAGVACGEV